MLFQDKTLTRLGAETFFSFKAGTRDLSLDRGTMLLQVPKGCGGARIRTASVTASITGTTIMIEHLPAKHLKVLVLEGSLRLSPNGRFGEAMQLTAGKMVIMKPDAKRIPEPVNVDLRTVVRTSALIDPAAFKGESKAQPAPLPSLALIEKEISQQDAQLKDRKLVATNLVIAGSGTEVTMASDETLAALDQGTLAKNALKEALTSDPAKTPLTEGVRNATDPRTQVRKVEESVVTPSVPETDPLPRLDITTKATVATTTVTLVVVDSGTGVAPSGTGTGSTGTGTGSTGTGTGTAVTFEVINTSSLTNRQTLTRTGADGLTVLAPGTGGAIDLRGPKIEIKADRINGINLNGGNSVLGLTQEGGDGGTLLLGTAPSPISGDITIETAGSKSGKFGGAGATTGGFNNRPAF